MKRTTVALIAGPVVAGGTALWLFAGASSTVSRAQAACHQQVVSTHRLPGDTHFTDSEKRATGDVIVVQGEARIGGRLAVTYSCSIRGAPGGGFTVQLSSSQHP